MDLPDLVFAIVGIGALLSSLLPRVLEGRPFSLPAVFLGLGLLLGGLPFLPVSVDIRGQGTLLEHATEVVVIISLMGAGLALDRRPTWRGWANTWRLLAVAMPLTILAVALLGMWALGLGAAAAVLLGAALAPTDPVLASEVQVGEPASEEVDADSAEDEVRFSLTSEAGLNDALAFPFVYLAITMAQQAGNGPGEWLAGWVGVDLVYRLAVGVLGGLLVGWGLSRVFFSSRRKVLRLAEHREGSVALAATFLAYGLTELAQGYGFLAVFVAAVTIRSSERFHTYHGVLHTFVEQVERFLTVLVLLVLGVALADGLLAGVGWREAVVATVVILVVRPAAAAVSLVGGSGSWTERGAIAFFGVRGVGSVYYLAYGLNSATFSEGGTLVAVIVLVITGSVVLHGITAGPAIGRLDAARSREAGARPRRRGSTRAAPA